MHISELAQHHVENPREVVEPGDEVQGQDPRDRLRAPPPLAEREARRGRPGAAAAAGGRERRWQRRAAISTTCRDLGLSEDVFAGAEGRAAPEDLRAAVGRAAAEAASPTGAPRPAEQPRRPRSRSSRGARARESPLAGPSRLPSPRRAAESPTPDEQDEQPSPEMADPVARVPFVGLTGGIGAGKSEALARWSELGAATLSTDAVVHELLATDEVRDAAGERLGDEVAPGRRDRPLAVAERVFGDPDQREWLEGMLWPRVGERVLRMAREVEPPTRSRRGRGRGAAAVRVRDGRRSSTRRSR